MIVDYHMHLRGPAVADGVEPLVHDVGTVERFVEVAAARGVDEIGFTEHVYYFRETREVWPLPYQLDRCTHRLDAYCEAILEAKRRGLPVKLGLEVDWIGAEQARLAELLAGYPWDFLLGSVHWLDGLAVDAEPGVWEAWPVEEVWRRYFDALGALAGSGTVDVLAHPDLVKKYGRRPPASVVAELHESAARAIAAAGVAVEVSTAGLRKPVGELYPDEGLLAACSRHGVPVTTASDAHQPELVGEEIGLAVELARRAGYATVSVFDGRRRRQEPLG